MIKESNEDDQITPRTPNTRIGLPQSTTPNNKDSSIKKIVIKRPFLTRGSGKAGGVGNPNQSVSQKRSQNENQSPKAAAADPVFNSKGNISKSLGQPRPSLPSNGAFSEITLNVRRQVVQ